MSTAEMTAADLRRYGEDATADWILTCADEELERVFQVAGYVYLRGGPLARAGCVAAVYVHEGAPRPLRRKRRLPLTEPEAPLLHNGRYTSLAVRRRIDELPGYGVGADLVEFLGGPESGWDGSRVTGTQWRRPEFGSRDDRGARWTTWIPEDVDGQVRWGVRRVGTPGVLAHTFFSVFPLAADALVSEEPQAVEFVQTTGTVDRLLVEIKRREPDGALRQYAVGRPSGGGGVEAVAQGEHEHRVPASEVHTTAAVEDLFSHYLRYRDVPSDLRLRELPEFREPASDRRILEETGAVDGGRSSDDDD